VRTLAWDRADAIERVRRDVWRHITDLARDDDDEIALVAATLLQMPAGDVRRLAQIHFVLSGAVERLLAGMPELSRRLSTVTRSEIEIADGRIRGPVRWGETYRRRVAAGTRHLHVTAPAGRAFATPENELLAFALDAIAEQGRATGWQERASRKWIGGVVARRVADAERWRQLRALADLPSGQPSAATIGRVRAGRWRRTYAAVLDVVDLHRRFVRRMDRDEIQKAVEQHALVTSRDDVLRELCCAFETLDVLRRLGWEAVEPEGVVESSWIFRARRDGVTLELSYQQTPRALARASRYGAVQRSHGLHAGAMRPDLVLRLVGPDGERWLIVEVKGGDGAPVEQYARAALRDLLAYRRAFEDALGAQDGVYGIGYAWGAELAPSHEGEVVLCTPDTLAEALEAALGAA
jgi:hypothetical protein